MPFLLFLIVAGVAAYFFFQTPVGKGVIGEWIVRFFIGKTREKPGREQFVVNDVILQTEDGKTAQIDHILINSRGVFVIETKNYSGRIYGHENQLQWTQVLAYGKVKNKVYNPVKQNATHIYRLKETVGVKTPFYSMIVFVKGNTKWVESDKVVDLYGIKRFILSKPNHSLAVDEMRRIYDILVKVKHNKGVTKKEHVQNINKMLNGIDNNICPRCGGSLVVRKSQKGDFMGCYNYPKCKFTKKV